VSGFARWPAVWQTVLVGSAAGAALAAAARATGVLDTGGAWAFGIGAAVAATAAAAWIARHAEADRHLVLAADAQLPGASADMAAPLPLDGAGAEQDAVRASVSRMLQRWRDQVAQLTAQNEALTLRLADRTHELHTLQDLSAGLARSSDVHGLVDEALAALQGTLGQASASIWARDEAATGAPVVLLGFRGAAAAASELGSASASAVAPAASVGSAAAAMPAPGTRLSRAHAQQYARLEQAREPVVENQARQGLLAWLWTRVSDDSRASALYRGTRSWMAVPLRVRDEVLGVLRVDHPLPDQFGAGHARLLAAVASQAALAMRQVRLQEREREIAVVAERNRIARDLHDAVSQALFAAHMLAQSLHQSARRADAGDACAGLVEPAAAMERLTRGALSEMRLLLFELRPDALQQAPLADLLRHAIGSLDARATLHVETRLDADLDVPPGQRVQLFRIAQEALSNVARHSKAEHVLVEWRPIDGLPTLRIIDDGCGFDPDQPRPGHFGLEHMSARAAEIGACLVLSTGPQEGTELMVQLGGSMPADLPSTTAPPAVSSVPPSAAPRPSP
jgi:signal transduction histidine kinase